MPCLLERESGCETPHIEMASVSVPVKPSISLYRLIASAAIVVALFLTIGYIVTRSPWWDEGLFADVALNFRNHGHFGSSALDPNGYLPWPGVHRYTYWQFPLYLLALGTWFHLVPATAQWMRVFSLVWAVVFIASWFVLVRAWSRDERLALFVASVLSLDYTVISAASDGRMEMMCVALGYAGLAGYSYLRERNWTAAICAGSIFAAGSFFCHPIGAVMTACLAGLVLLDWREIRLPRLWIACIPYLLGALLWAWYILQAPTIFCAQYHAATSYRVRTLFSVLKSIFMDAYNRYWVNFFVTQAGINRLRVIIPIFAIIGTIALAIDPALRRQALGRRLLLLAFISYIGIAAIDNQGFPFYMVYSLPVLTGCGAVWVYARWQQTGVRKLLPALSLSLSLGVVVGGFTLKEARDDYRTAFQPAVAAALAHRQPGGLIMGGSELGFPLGFDSGKLIDDRYLGYFSGLTPDVYVESQYYHSMPGPELTRAWNASRQRLRNGYHVVFQNQDYLIYARNQSTR